MEQLYTSTEARRILKVSTSSFKRLIDSGKIRKITPPNKKQGMYVKDDVDTLAEAMKPFSKARERQELVTSVDWQKISDLPAILKLDLKVYHENIVGDINLYISWEKKNPHITMLAFDGNNRERVFAYLSLVPLPENVILSILRGEREELSISADEVETYERRGGYTLLAESVVVDPDHPEQLNHILREVLHHWCKQYPDRYIEKIYADAVSDHGDMLARKLYFSPLYDVSDTAYVLDLRKPGISKVVRSFQECLRQRATRRGDSKTDSKDSKHPPTKVYNNGQLRQGSERETSTTKAE